MPVATVMQALKPFTPTMVGGSADLVESNKTEFAGAGIFSATHVGRNIAFGIREHAMGSIVNGIALDPAMLRPYGSTFLIFSDYMRGAVRLSALMGLRTAWVWTHDSIAVGEDGPTHQPVEHHMALRAIPNLWYVRPADANETSMAWRIALERLDGPVALALTRQKLPTFDRIVVASADGALRGAYTLWQRGDGTPEAIVIATGSEVHLALEAARSLEANVRVVSMPCWELFDEQDDDYQESVLPPSVEVRVAVEAGVTLGWERYASAIIGIDHFGASAPYQRIFSELGITADADRRHAGGGARVRIAVSFDHRGVRLRDGVLAAIAAEGHQAVDLGVDTDAVRVDYPDNALALGMAIRKGEADRGVLVCGSGVGASIAASKIPGIRAAICHDAYSAHQGVEHDDMNVLCLGSEIVGGALADELVRTFLGARFIGGGRYADRLEKVAELERMADG